MLNDIDKFDGIFIDMPFTAPGLQEHPPVVLVCVGDGDDHRQLIVQLNQRLEGMNVVILGAGAYEAVKRPQLSDLSDMLHLVTQGEDTIFPNYLLEDVNKPWYRQYSKRGRGKKY